MHLLTLTTWFLKLRYWEGLYIRVLGDWETELLTWTRVVLLLQAPAYGYHVAWASGAGPQFPAGRECLLLLLVRTVMAPFPLCSSDSMER